jgi:hypothetical protein
MNVKNALGVSLAAASLMAVIAMVAHTRRGAVGTTERSVQPAATAMSPIAEPPPPVEVPVIETQPPFQPMKIAKVKKAAAKAGSPAKAKAPIQDPDARAALSLVGVDPEAEAYWMGAVNDPSLPAEERKDLIEDLNEDGLSDPKHPGPEDVPLIVNRLRLIEELAPNAIDQVNMDAFAEAYKDLNNLLAGNPVK